MWEWYTRVSQKGRVEIRTTTGANNDNDANDDPMEEETNNSSSMSPAKNPYPVSGPVSAVRFINTRPIRFQDDTVVSFRNVGFMI